MKVKSVEYIQENEVLAFPVYTEEGEILIPKGAVLKKEYIDILTSLGIKEVEIQDKYCSYELPVLLISQQDQEKYIKRIQKLLENHIYKKRESLSSVKELALDLVEYAKKIDLNRVYDILYQRTNLYRHTLNVTLLSLITARKLKLSEDSFYPIAVAALLHDLGLRYITIPFIEQDLDMLNLENMFEYKKHTILAYTVLDGKEEWLPDISKDMILSHHEKMDGSGFPLKQKNQKVECKIIQLCDTFDCLVFGMECKRNSINEVIDYICSQSEIKYDKNVTAALFSMIAKYPVGTEVQLSNGKYGIVRGQTKYSDFPIIMELTKPGGEIIDNKILNLETNQENRINKII